MFDNIQNFWENTMATTYYYPDLQPRGTSLRPILKSVPGFCRGMLEVLRGGAHQAVDFIDMWICCNGVDDEMVIENVFGVIEPNDHLAEEFLEFTHSPKRRHRTARPRDVDIFDNELPLTRQPDQQQDEGSGNPNIELIGPTAAPAVETAMPQPEVGAAMEVTAIVLFRYPDDIVVHNQVAPVPEPSEPDTDRPEEDEELDTPGPSLVYTICQDAIEVKASRRIATNGRKFYEASVVSEIKSKLGVPKFTEANKLAVRRAAHRIMEKHGVRPSHMRQSMEKIIAGVFIPDRFDVEAAKMMASNTVANIQDEYHDAGPKNGWSRVCDMLRFGNGRRGTSRVPPVTGPP